MTSSSPEFQVQVLFRGLQGCGKSSAGRVMAELLEGDWVNQDEIAFAEKALPRHGKRVFLAALLEKSAMTNPKTSEKRKHVLIVDKIHTLKQHRKDTCAHLSPLNSSKIVFEWLHSKDLEDAQLEAGLFRRRFPWKDEKEEDLRKLQKQTQNTHDHSKSPGEVSLCPSSGSKSSSISAFWTIRRSPPLCPVLELDPSSLFLRSSLLTGVDNIALSLARLQGRKGNHRSISEGADLEGILRMTAGSAEALECGELAALGVEYYGVVKTEDSRKEQVYRLLEGVWHVAKEKGVEGLRRRIEALSEADVEEAIERSQCWEEKVHEREEDRPFQVSRASFKGSWTEKGRPNASPSNRVRGKGNASSSTWWKEPSLSFQSPPRYAGGGAYRVSTAPRLASSSSAAGRLPPVQFQIVLDPPSVDSCFQVRSLLPPQVKASTPALHSSCQHITLLYLPSAPSRAEQISAAALQLNKSEDAIARLVLVLEDLASEQAEAEAEVSFLVWGETACLSVSLGSAQQFCGNEYPHVTVGVGLGRSARESNSVLSGLFRKLGEGVEVDNFLDLSYKRMKLRGKVCKV